MSASTYISNVKQGRAAYNGDELSKHYTFAHEEIRRVSVIFHGLSLSESHPLIRDLINCFGDFFIYSSQLITPEDSLDSAQL